jgi:poly(hydroxyalkanoate) granule-associated protein
MPEETGPEAERPPEPEEERPNFFRNLWYASVGLAAVAGESAGRIAGLLVKKGREAEPGVREQSRQAAEELRQAMADLREQIRIVGERVSRAATNAESAVDAKIASKLRNMGFSEKEEVEELKRKLEELKAQLEELRGRAAPPPFA